MNWKGLLEEETQTGEERQQLKGSHEKLVAKLISRGEGRAGSVHKVTTPAL